MPFPQLWNALFFLMIITLGVGSQVGVILINWLELLYKQRIGAFYKIYAAFFLSEWQGVHLESIFEKSLHAHCPFNFPFKDVKKYISIFCRGLRLVEVLKEKEFCTTHIGSYNIYSSYGFKAPFLLVVNITTFVKRMTK